VPSAVFELLKAMVTSAAGWLVKTTVNWAVPPASDVCSPLVGLTVMPAVAWACAYP